MDIQGLPFAKGHGTGNDFVIVPDPDGRLELSPAVVAQLCDRRRGLGGDGLLRVVRTDAAGLPADAAQWFLDYRNADGSLAEMCGNGVRVYARYLVESGLAEGPRVPILTRAGLVVAQVGAETIAVDMPLPQVSGRSTVRVSGVDLPGTVATCGNPNLVCTVADPAALDLTAGLVLDPAVFPAGANVEFVTARAGRAPMSTARAGRAPMSTARAGRAPMSTARADLHVEMRVVERGVGETLSCGSGACAAAAVVLAGAGRDSGTVTVDVPGGRLSVTLGEGRCVLAGPAVIVATGTLGSFPSLITV